MGNRPDANRPRFYGAFIQRYSRSGLLASSLEDNPKSCDFSKVFFDRAKGVLEGCPLSNSYSDCHLGAVRKVLTRFYSIFYI